MPGPSHPAPIAPESIGSSGEKHTIRVVLADNHAAMRRSLRRLLDGEAGVEVIVEAGDLPTVLREVQGRLPQVLVLDLGMRNGSSVEAIRHLRRDTPGPEIVVLTMQESPEFARQAIAAGAVGFVLKERADSELPEAIRSAARGEEYVSPASQRAWTRCAEPRVATASFRARPSADRNRPLCPPSAGGAMPTGPLVPSSHPRRTRS